MSAAVSNSPPINNHVINDTSLLDTSTDSASCRNTYTHLTYSRHHLIDIANDTLKITKNGQYTNSNGDIVDIKQDSDASVENSVHYEHEFDFHYALKEYDNEKECVGPVCPVSNSNRKGLISSIAFHADDIILDISTNDIHPCVLRCIRSRVSFGVRLSFSADWILVREMSVRCVDDNFNRSSCKDDDDSGDDDGDGM